jgi:formate dehydrogenase iron-sulfur subunit
VGPAISVDGVAYGPVTVADCPGLAAVLLGAGDHPMRLGVTEQIDYLRNQSRITFARVRVLDPRSADDSVAHGGLDELKAALALAPAGVAVAVGTSG